MKFWTKKVKAHICIILFNNIYIFLVISGVDRDTPDTNKIETKHEEDSTEGKNIEHR